ncbi:hypothetical protein BH11PLA1_BH11PLA1_05950 [soil metagenome]
MLTPRSALRRRSPLGRASTHIGPNMTPMVDVVMVILVFFMVSAAFAGPEWFLSTLLPRPALAEGEGEPDPALPVTAQAPLEMVRITLSLTANEAGETRVTGEGMERVTLAEAAKVLAARVADLPAGAEAGSKIEILIKPEPNVPYKDVVRLHELVLEAGIVRVGYETP